MEICVFDSHDGRCKCLTKKNCSSCTFKKTKKQLDEGRKAAMTRLISLPNSGELLEKYHQMSKEQAMLNYWELIK